MITGQSLYRTHRWAAKNFGVDLLPWEELIPSIQEHWNLRAFAQEERDRPERQVNYDGPYSDNI